MRKQYGILLLLVLLSFKSRAQLPLINLEAYADSLNKVLQTSTNDSQKARVHFLLVNYWLFSDPAKANAHQVQGKSLSRKYPFLYALSYYTEGACYFNSDEAKSAAAYKTCDSLLSRFTTKEAYYSRSNVWNNLALLHQMKGDDRTYIDLLLNKAIPFALLANDSAVVSSEYVNVAIAFINMEQYDKAEHYLNRAIVILKRANLQPGRLVAAYNRAAGNYMQLHKYELARQILDTIQVILKPFPAHELTSDYYMVEGIYAHYLKKYKSALAYFDRGIATADGADKIYHIREIQYYRIKTLLADKQYKLAEQLLMELLSNKEVMSDMGTKLTVYEEMAELYAGTGQSVKAYEWLKRYKLFSDSLRNDRLQKDINELEAKFRNADKERQIAVLALEHKQSLLKAKDQQLTNRMLAVVSIFLLVTSAILVVYYHSSRKLAKQEEINYAQQLKEIAQQQQLQLTRAMLEGEERERRRMARDLHDGLGGMLAGIKIRLSNQSLNTDQAALDPVLFQLDQSVTELRRIARNMMPESLLQFGLETALKDLCESLMTAKTSIDFQAFGISPLIQPTIQTNIYRIIQESLNNAVRHAEATQILVQCSQNDNMLFITIEDNGKGFDSGSDTHKPGIGINSIRNRVEYLKGKMEILSAPGEGTTINIELYVAG